MRLYAALPRRIAGGVGGRAHWEGAARDSADGECSGVQHWRGCASAASQVLESYQKLAEHYEDESDSKTCIYFWEKYLEI